LKKIGDEDTKTIKKKCQTVSYIFFLPLQ